MTLRRPIRSELLPLLVLAALPLAFLWRTTVGGKAMLPGDLLLIMEPWRHYSDQFPEFDRVGNPILDAVQQFYPWRKYAGESLRQGLIPLWNPYEFCGNPFVGNDQSAVFYPETWLHALMAPEHALGWATALCLFVAGGLTYWFLRVLELRRSAALLGAVAFMFNGFIVGWLCFPSLRSVPGWLPGMLAAFELSLRRQRSRWAAVCALFVGMQFLAGNLHISLFVLIVFFAYAAFRCVGAWVRGERRAAALAAAGALAASLLGALLAAVQLLPTLELATMSGRAGGLPYAYHLKHALQVPYLLAALMPDLFGNPVDYNHWGCYLGPVYRAYTETAWYIGVAPVLLAPAAFLRRPRSLAWFWLALLASGLALAMGTPLYALIYHLVPVAQSLPGIGRAILMASTALAMLGALGLDALLEQAHTKRPDQVRRYALAAGAGILLVGLIGGLWAWVASGAYERVAPGLGAYTLLQIARFGLFCVLAAVLVGLLPWRKRLAAGLLVVLLAADLFWFFVKFTPATRPEYLHLQAQSIELIKQDTGWPRILALGRDGIHRMGPNTPMIVGLEDIQGSDSLDIGAYRRLLNGLSSEELGFPQPDPTLPALDLLGVKYIVSAVELKSIPGVSLLPHYDSWLYLNEQALPRAFTVPDYVVKSEDAQALAAVTSRDFEPSKKAVFVGPDRPSGRHRPPLLSKPVQVTAHEPNAVTVVGDLRPGQVLVLADAYYPGWRAFQDGRECRVLRADYALRAVQIEQPCKQVRFVYLPASFTVGAFASLAAVAFLAGVAAFCLLPRRPNNERTGVCQSSKVRRPAASYV